MIRVWEGERIAFDLGNVTLESDVVKLCADGSLSVVVVCAHVGPKHRSLGATS